MNDKAGYGPTYLAGAACAFSTILTLLCKAAAEEGELNALSFLVYLMGAALLSLPSWLTVGVILAAMLSELAK